MGADNDRIVSVERLIPAAADAIFDVIADPRRHQEIDGSGTVRDADVDGPERLSEGAKFGMNMKMGMKYRMVNHVVEFEKDRRIAWAPIPAIGSKELGFIGGRIWRYELEPAEGGTLVRETWDASGEKGFLFLKLSKAPERTRKAMTATLERLEQVVTGA